MAKFKYIFLLICITGCFVACKKNNIVDDYDPIPQYKADTTAIRAYINTNGIPATKDETGVFYQIIDPGTGDKVYNNSTVFIDYQGRLLDGTIFADTKGTPITFNLGAEIIYGWKIGIPKIQKGGKIRLIVPSFYGFGTGSPSSSVPANSILDFTITLTDVQ